MATQIYDEIQRVKAEAAAAIVVHSGPPSISHHLDDLAAAVSNAHDAVSELYARLEPALTDTEPAAPTEARNVLARSDTARRVLEFAESIRDLTLRVERLSERVDF